MLLDFAGKPLDQGDEVGMAPIAVAAEAHGLPGFAVNWHLFTTSQAASGIETNGARLHLGGGFLFAEKFFGRDLVTVRSVSGGLRGFGVFCTWTTNEHWFWNREGGGDRGWSCDFGGFLGACR